MLTYQVTSIKDIVNIIIPFFEAHPLLSSKIYNYNDF
jgi:LAGLIDADG endonuclease